MDNVLVCEGCGADSWLLEMGLHAFGKIKIKEMTTARNGINLFNFIICLSVISRKHSVNYYQSISVFAAGCKFSSVSFKLGFLF
jgi:hypothetical protein